MTPLLAGLVLHAHGALSLDALRSVLPLMVFYQIQVMACAELARRYASR